MEAVVAKKMKESGRDDLSMACDGVEVQTPDIKAQASAFVKAVHSKNGAPRARARGTMQIRSQARKERKEKATNH